MDNKSLPTPPTIHVTYDYSLFTTFPLNRKAEKSQKLVRSISRADLTPYTPILVDKNMAIIDGQHRVQACKKLGLPIFFVVAKDDVDTSLAIQLLQEQTVWRMSEFLHFQSVVQGGCYADLERFEKMWNLGISNSMVVYPAKAITSQTLREGVMHFDKNTKADDIAAFLCSSEVMALKHGRTRPFCLAVRKAFDIYNNRELSKIQRRLITIPQCANYEQYLTAFANIVNRRNKS